ncbi:MAG: CdvA-like protein [Thaumarchaeota archaeon]|nr:CdvA-like protein [Nitrososphaerota archaeon]
MMHSQTLANLVRKQVKDSYGRHIGNVIGFSLDNVGHIKALAVEHTGGDFGEYTNERILFEGEYIVLLPDWKEEVERLKRDTTLAQKRASVLDNLSKEGEISSEAYEHLKMQYDAEIAALRNTYTSLTDGLKERISILEHRNAQISKFSAGLKVQYRTGESDEQTYRAAMESVNRILKSDIEEQAEISGILAWLTGSDAVAKQDQIAPTITA